MNLAMALRAATGSYDLDKASHNGIVETYEFQESASAEAVLMHPNDTGLWQELPNDPAAGALDHQTSTLTILPSVDIDADSDNTAVIDRSDWEEQIENEVGYPGKLVQFNDDDDNENGIEDYLENAAYGYPNGGSWVPFNDDDLVPVVLDRGFADLSGMDGFVFELKVTSDPNGTAACVVRSYVRRVP